MNKFESIISSIYCFLQGISIDSVQYLGWISAIVAALLALTAIVFSQQNDKVIQTSNDLAREIKITALEEEINFSEITKKFNKILSLLQNQRVYKQTLVLFSITSFLGGVLWIIGAAGYFLDMKTPPDKILVLFSTILLCIPLFFLPLIIMNFNKEAPIELNKYKKFTLDSFVEFFNFGEKIKTDTIFKELLSTKILIGIDNKKKLYIELMNEVPLTDFAVVIILGRSNSEKLTFRITSKGKKELSNKLILLPSDNNSFEGLFDFISTSLSRHNDIYFTSLTGDTKAVFKLKKVASDDNKILLSLNTYEGNKSFIKPVLDKLSHKYDTLSLKTQDKNLVYLLSENSKSNWLKNKQVKMYLDKIKD
ncbi:hypothetical protein [Schinkia azotoformans]|uniref:hypothetical protein n=1 Tax=Schinkia azotoformans TaxID=1454 RepID=UPI002DBAFE07|nr:hypothetical protein [Schinkia azotoformans]MEC1719055.1 hypothetical protein [Schinkia azotoformans]MED4413896.1 hypothetical protein [Schinkia azotoformans]